MDVYARVRRAVQVDGMSVRQAAREFGLSRKTLPKLLAYSVPPGYQRIKPVKRPKLGPWLGVIGDPTLADGILDRLVHSAHRIEMRGESMRKKRSAAPTP